MLSYPLGEPTAENTPLQAVERCLTRVLVSAVRDIIDVSDAPNVARRAFLEAVVKTRIYDLRETTDFIKLFGELRLSNTDATEALIVGGERFVAMLRMLNLHSTLVDTLTSVAIPVEDLTVGLIVDDELEQAFDPPSDWKPMYAKILGASNWILFYLAMSYFLSFSDIAHYLQLKQEAEEEGDNG